MQVGRMMASLIGPVLLISLWAQIAAAIDIGDTFTRSNSTNLGVTEVGGFGYIETGTTGFLDDVGQISDGQLQLFGVDGPGGTGPGLAVIDVDLADMDISFDMRFAGLNDPTGGATNNTGGFFLRRPAANSTFTNGEGQVEVGMLPGGGFLIRETHNGALSTLYFDSPFSSSGGSTDNTYSPPGSLPQSIGGLPFDVDQNGVLEEDEPFRLGASLVGNTLTMKINDVSQFDLTVSRSAPSGQTSLVALYKNRFTRASGLDPTDPTFDNLVISSVAPPPPPPIVHNGNVNPVTDEGWFAQNAGSIANNGPIDDGGVAAWSLDDNGGGSRAAYIRSLTSEQLVEAQSKGWRYRGRLRVVDVDDTRDGAIEMSVFPVSNKGFVLWFGSDSEGNPTVAGIRNTGVGQPLEFTESFTATGSGYHDYEMVWDPATDTVDVFVDGGASSVISGYGGFTIGPTLNRILWGSNSGSGVGQSNWSRTEFVVVPEPSSVVLLSLGMVGLCALSRRRKETNHQP